MLSIYHFITMLQMHVSINIFKKIISNQSAFVMHDFTCQYTAGKGHCGYCGSRESNLRRHFLKNHSTHRAVYFCPADGCPAVLCDVQGLRDHLRGGTHKGDQVSAVVIGNLVSQNCYWPLPQAMANAIIDGGQRLQAYGMLYSMTGVAMFRKFFCPSGRPMHRVVRDVIDKMRPRFGDPHYRVRVDRRKREKPMVTPPVRPVS